MMIMMIMMIECCIGFFVSPKVDGFLSGVVLLGLLIAMVVGYRKTHCDWCGKKIPWDSGQRQVIKEPHLEFCCLKCSMKYKNEQVDLDNKAKGKNTTTRNVNVNDRNKFLRDK